MAEGQPIERLRRRLTYRRTALPLQDYGAGPANQGGGPRQATLGRLARRAACPRRKGERLLRLTRHLQPQRMLELGTHLGFSALYQLTGAPQATLITLEGSDSLADLAQQHLQRFGFQADLRRGSFDDSLADLPLAAYQPDYVYLDGDHRYEATLRYVDQIAPHMPDGGVIILDDLYWSPGMTRAWQAICARPDVSVSIDCFHLGLCFLRRKEDKQHVVLW
jgi:predicted O-methyltransferase YrrM